MDRVQMDMVHLQLFYGMFIGWKGRQKNTVGNVDSTQSSAGELSGNLFSCPVLHKTAVGCKQNASTLSNLTLDHVDENSILLYALFSQPRWVTPNFTVTLSSTSPRRHLHSRIWISVSDIWILDFCVFQPAIREKLHGYVPGALKKQ